MPNESMPRLVVCAALRNSAGRIICGARHYDPIMRAAIRNSLDPVLTWRGCEQGFIDQRGTWLSRAEAHGVATAAGQIRRRCGGDDGTLYSENLY